MVRGDQLGDLWPPGGVGIGGGRGGDEGGRRCGDMCVCVWLIRFVVEQKLTHHCRAIVLQ